MRSVIIEPVFYLSEYFESNREEYYENLNNITENNDWQGWVEFFLKAVINQSELNLIKIKEIMELYEKMKYLVQESTKSQYSSIILDTLFMKPIITSTNFAQLTRIERKGTANTILQKLTDKGILKLIEEGSGNRASMYAFADLINLTEGQTVI